MPARTPETRGRGHATIAGMLHSKKRLLIHRQSFAGVARLFSALLCEHVGVGGAARTGKQTESLGRSRGAHLTNIHIA